MSMTTSFEVIISVLSMRIVKWRYCINFSLRLTWTGLFHYRRLIIPQFTRHKYSFRSKLFRSEIGFFLYRHTFRSHNITFIFSIWCLTAQQKHANIGDHPFLYIMPAANANKKKIIKLFEWFLCWLQNAVILLPPSTSSTSISLISSLLPYSNC